MATFTGTAGDDSLLGTGGDDTFHLEDGGDDTARGGDGDDVFFMGGSLTAEDRIKGDAGENMVVLDGDYSSGLAFTETMMVGIGTLRFIAGHSYSLTGLASVNFGGHLVIDGSGLGAGDALLIDASAVGATPISMLGGLGSDSLAGGSGADTFIGGGGQDTLQGGAGDDLFDFGAGYLAAERIDGGQGNDLAIFDGDYSGGVTFEAGGLDNVEAIRLAAGHSYAFAGLEYLTLSALSFDAGELGAGDKLTIDGDLRGGRMIVQAGAGDDSVSSGYGFDSLNGGAGDDTLSGGPGNDTLDAGVSGDDLLRGGPGDDQFIFAGDFTQSDRVNGGAGRNYVTLAGGQAAPIMLGGHTFANIANINLVGGAYDISISDKALGAGAFLGVSAFGGDGQVRFDGSRESDARFELGGGSHSDTLIGGAGDDTMRGYGGTDTMIGGAGDDHLVCGDIHDPGDKYVGGLGADVLTGGRDGADRYFYLDVADSTATAPDEITTLGDNDIIWLQPIDADVTTAGNQAFHLVSALTGHAGELALSYDGDRDLTVIQGDVDGDGVADLVILADGYHPGFTGFQL